MTKSVDYIIVGNGFASFFFAHQLVKNKKSFILFSSSDKGASQVSAGVINPVVLKKFTTFWKAKEQIDFLQKTLAEIESYIGTNFGIDSPIHRVFHDENERNLWLKKSQNSELNEFLDDDFKSLSIINNPHQTGQVKHSSRLDVYGFFNGLTNYFEKNDSIIDEDFDYSELTPELNTYKNIHFKNLVFCEGIRVLENPFFKNIPVQPNKGHHLKVKLKRNLIDNVIIKKKHFLFPLNTGWYYYGGTYDRDNVENKIDNNAVHQLSSGLSEFYPFDFEFKEVNFGFRPTVKDRKPILGSHPKFKNFYVFNGLGARGILNGCYFSQHLFDHIEYGKELYPEVNLNRFTDIF